MISTPGRRMPFSARARSCLRPSALAVVALVVLAPTGCDSGGSLQTVSGKVTVDGNPLGRGSVRFVPDKDKGNKTTTEPAGEIKSDGTYTLTTNGKTGAPVGWYKVTVTATELAESSNPYGGKVLVAPKYNVPETSGISIEVKSSPPAGAYDIAVTSR
jgi:hypothetical protein